MNTLDPRLKRIIKEQLLVGLPEGIIDTMTRNIERAWQELPEATGNPREHARDCAGGGDVDGTYLEETRLDVLDGNMLDVNENSCCPIGHPGVQGPQGVK